MEAELVKIHVPFCTLGFGNSLPSTLFFLEQGIGCNVGTLFLLLNFFIFLSKKNSFGNISAFVSINKKRALVGFRTYDQTCVDKQSFPLSNSFTRDKIALTEEMSMMNYFLIFVAYFVLALFLNLCYSLRSLDK